MKIAGGVYSTKVRIEGGAWMAACTLETVLSDDEIADRVVWRNLEQFGRLLKIKGGSRVLN